MAAQQHPFVLPNPLAEMGKLCQGALAAAQCHVKKLQAKQQAFASQARLPPRIVVLPRAGCMAAIIPGDSTAELVLTNGLNNFLWVALATSVILDRLGCCPHAARSTYIVWSPSQEKILPHAAGMHRRSADMVLLLACVQEPVQHRTHRAAGADVVPQPSRGHRDSTRVSSSCWQRISMHTSHVWRSGSWLCAWCVYFGGEGVG